MRWAKHAVCKIKNGVPAAHLFDSIDRDARAALLDALVHGFPCHVAQPPCQFADRSEGIYLSASNNYIYISATC